MVTKKLYVLVRKDLASSYQAVQAGHAVAKWLLHDKSWKNETLIYLGVNDEQALKRWMDKLDYRQVPYVIFKEPDINNEITALATNGNSKLFNKLNLM